MKRMMIGGIAMSVLGVCVASLLGATARAQAPAVPASPPPPPNAETQQHLRAAQLLSADDIRIMKYACPAQPPLPKAVTSGQDQVVAPPTKIFDNLYFLGSDFVAAYALNTSAGIILFDTMNNNDDVQKIIIAGLKKVNLDPAKIKYIVISHGHGDHYGGAKALQELYNAKVLAGPLDWDMMDEQQTNPPQYNIPWLPKWGTPPKRDMAVSDGQKLVLGDTTVTLQQTPGHTPDTVSAIFPVMDKGMKHMATWIGGTLGNKEQMAHSYEKLLERSEQAGSDVYISPHPYADSAWSVIDRDVSKIHKLQAAKPGDPNPFVAGKDKVIRYMMTHIECTYAGAAYARQQAAK